MSKAVNVNRDKELNLKIIEDPKNKKQFVIYFVIYGRSELFCFAIWTF